MIFNQYLICLAYYWVYNFLQLSLNNYWLFISLSISDEMTIWNAFFEILPDDLRARSGRSANAAMANMSFVAGGRCCRWFEDYGQRKIMNTLNASRSFDQKPILKFGMSIGFLEALFCKCSSFQRITTRCRRIKSYVEWRFQYIISRMARILQFILAIYSVHVYFLEVLNHFWQLHSIEH